MQRGNLACSACEFLADGFSRWVALLCVPLRFHLNAMLEQWPLPRVMRPLPLAQSARAPMLMNVNLMRRVTMAEIAPPLRIRASFLQFPIHRRKFLRDEFPRSCARA